jgi:hypothetical protein
VLRFPPRLARASPTVTHRRALGRRLSAKRKSSVLAFAAIYARTSARRVERQRQLAGKFCRRAAHSGAALALRALTQAQHVRRPRVHCVKRCRPATCAVRQLARRTADGDRRRCSVVFRAGRGLTLTEALLKTGPRLFSALFRSIFNLLQTSHISRAGEKASAGRRQGAPRRGAAL